MLLHFSTIGVSVHTEQPSVSIEGMRMNVELCHDVLGRRLKPASQHIREHSVEQAEACSTD